MKASLAEARKILKAKAVKSVSPAKLVQTAQSIGKSLDQTLDLIAYLKTSGSGYGPSPVMQKILTGKYE